VKRATNFWSTKPELEPYQFHNELFFIDYHELLRRIPLLPFTNFVLGDDISYTRHISDFSIPSLEPLSVAASIVGLLEVGSQMSSFLSSIVTKFRDGPSFAQRLRQEITDISAVLNYLQTYITGTTASADRASLILLEDVLITLTGCVITYSELQAILNGLNFNPEMGAFDLMKWAQQEPTITNITLRLRQHKRSLILMRTILKWYIYLSR
jgi:hypothetical protein